MLTVEDVAEKIGEEGICINDVKKWERGMTYPDTPIIAKLANIYHVSSRELMYYKQKTIDMQIEQIHTKLIKAIEKWLSSIRITTLILFAICAFLFYIIIILPIFTQIQNNL